jgi:peptidoglycan biosynthesis protein MviN/MurJ (putative lipid II flippase)
MYFSFIKPLRKENSGFEVRLNYSDFNLPTLILGNFANIIIISSRLAAGADGSIDITFFMYAVVLLNALLTAVIGNVSTILLRKITIKKSTILMMYSLLISIFVGLLMVLALYFYSTEIVKFVYLRGAFNISDVEQTASYLSELSFAFLLLFVSTILFQPFLTLSIEKTKKIRLGMVIFFLLSIVFALGFSEFNLYTSKESSFLLMYISSVVSVILSIYSYFKYIQYER